MIEAPARVLSVEPGYAWVTAERRSACGDCATSQSCGLSSVGKWFGSQVHTVRIRDPLGVQAGDDIVIGLSEARLVSAAAGAYLIPLVCMLALAVLGSEVGETEAAPALLGLTGLIVGLWWSRRVTTRGRTARRVDQPVILRRQVALDCSISVGPAGRRSAA